MAFLVLFTLSLLPFSMTVTADDSPDLGVLKAKVRFGKVGQGDSLSISGAFDPNRVSPTFDPESDSLSVTIGPVTVISFPSEEPRANLKTGKSSKFVCVLKKTRDARDSRKLVIDAAKGKFTLKARRIDLEALKSAGPEDVTITLAIGDAVYSNTLTMGQKDGRWRFRFVAGAGGWPSGVPGLPPGGGGGGGGGGAGGGPVTFRILPQGPLMGLTTFTTTVVRTGAEFNAEWWKRYPPLPPGSKAPIMLPPKVDFTKEMVVIIDLGMRPSAGYTMDVTKATAVGNGVKIDWVEKKPGPNCVVATVITQPVVLAAVSRRDGTVTFSGSVQTINCP
jgi:hypothetical protein